MRSVGTVMLSAKSRTVWLTDASNDSTTLCRLANRPKYVWCWSWMNRRRALSFVTASLTLMPRMIAQLPSIQ
jgi:hypothetical protein